MGVFLLSWLILQIRCFKLSQQEFSTRLDQKIALDSYPINENFQTEANQPEKHAFYDENGNAQYKGIPYYIIPINSNKGVALNPIPLSQWNVN